MSGANSNRWCFVATARAYMIALAKNLCSVNHNTDSMNSVMGIISNCPCTYVNHINTGFIHANHKMMSCFLDILLSVKIKRMSNSRMGIFCTKMDVVNILIGAKRYNMKGG